MGGYGNGFKSMVIKSMVIESMVIESIVIELFDIHVFIFSENGNAQRNLPSGYCRG